MSSLLFVTLVALSAVVAATALLRLKSARTRGVRLRCVKVAVGSLGSLAIVVGVQLLTDLLPILVVAFAVLCLAKSLARNTSAIVLFFDKQLAKMS